MRGLHHVLCDSLVLKTYRFLFQILTITDRTFFKTLKIGWLRHGVAEIVKMAVVKDEELFCDLEKVGSDLFKSKFGIDEGAVETAGIKQLSDKILAAAMRSYVSAEYENLYRHISVGLGIWAHLVTRF